MPKQTITDLKEFRNAIETLDKKVRRGLENGNVTEVMNLNWDLVLAVATSTATECVAEKEKKSNIFLFQFLMAYGEARQQDQHYSPEFLEKMHNLLKNEGSSGTPEPQDRRSEHPNNSSKLSNRMQNATRQHARPSPKKCCGTGKIGSASARPVKPESDPEDDSDASNAARPPKRRRIGSTRASAIKTFAELEASEDDTGNDDTFIPSRYPSEPKSPEETPKPKTVRSTSKRNKSSARQSKEKSVGPGHDERMPVKATKWIHSITSELEDDRNPKITPRGALNLIKVGASTPFNSRARSVAGHHTELPVNLPTAESAINPTMADAKESDTVNVSNETTSPQETSSTPSAKAKGKQVERLVKTWDNWFHEDAAQSSSTQPPPPLPPRPSYIRDWDLEDDTKGQDTNTTLSTEDRLTRLEKKCDQIIQKMKRIDDQLTSYDHGFDYITGKLTFFVSLVELIDSKVDTLNHFNAEVIERMTVMRREVNVVLRDMYEHSSSEAEGHTHYDAPQTYQSGNATQNNGNANASTLASMTDSTDVGREYVPVHSHSKLAALAKTWSGGTSDKPIDLEEHETPSLASGDCAKDAENNADQAKLAKPALQTKMRTSVNATASLPSRKKLAKETNHAHRSSNIRVESPNPNSNAEKDQNTKQNTKDDNVQHVSLTTRLDDARLSGHVKLAKEAEVVEQALSPNSVNTAYSSVHANHADDEHMNTQPDSANNSHQQKKILQDQGAEIAKDMVSNKDARGEDKAIAVEQDDQSSPRVSIPHNSHERENCLTLVPYHRLTAVPPSPVIPPQSFSNLANPLQVLSSPFPPMQIGPDGNLLTPPGSQDDQDDMVEY
ncbi:hypothetical protein JR316_0001585 [Psilocybe cubensis]|uniref:Uncharacterized protein n=2 Tax=Psilocybe cubensis TaxID=181762 RepID=A0A8H7Y3G0_PSICU|nr:hypothetical protein JR316_0001585 [Psilocybe cubensis]KAH9484686.1 hypothetical protein JR316_0001585 [Psilocybe cubensis]